MTLPLNDEDRELLLSKYIDGELSPEDARAVAGRIREDPDWRGDYEELKAADRAAARVIERYHQDSPLAREVVRRVQGRKSVKRLRHTHRRPVVRGGGRWLFRLAASAALVAGAVFGWKYHTAYQSAQRTGAEPLVAASTTPASTAPAAAPLPLSNDLTFSTLADGTQVWMRKGSRLETVEARSVKFEGEAYFHIAAANTPFTIVTPDGHETQALGTRFDVKTGADGARVRVAEGHVRMGIGHLHDNGTFALSVDAYGGTEILPDLRTRPVDPRAVAAEWSKFAPPASAPAVATGMISSWSQAGGAPSHSGMTPLPGPAALVAHNDVFFALPDPNTTVQSGVVVAGGNLSRAYAMVCNRSESDKQSALMRLEMTGAQRGAWKTCATLAGHANCAPVVTPHGLVVFEAGDGSLKAYSPADEKIAWSLPLNAEILGLAAGNDESVICSTKAGLVALKGRDGQLLWRFNGMGVVHVKWPACILPDGGAIAVSEAGVLVQLDSGGHLVRSKQLGEKLTEAPAASESGDAVWLSSIDGSVARYSTHDGSLTDRHFGKSHVTGPLGNGVFAVNGQLTDFTQSAPENMHGDAAIALVRDGRGDLFTAFKNAVLHQRAGKEPELVHISRGEVIPGGLSLAPGMLIVTTTQGVQVFE